MAQVHAQLLNKFPIITDQVDRRELEVILSLLESMLDGGASGSVVEFGCYVGTTSLFIRRLLDHYQALNDFHVYDSFAGLPDKVAADASPAGEQFKAGELSVSKKDFIMNFKKANLRAPIIHKGWFSDLSADDIPPEISFAFLDGDYYESINDSLRLIWPNLVDGAIVIVDDYANEALPGASRAVDEWLVNHPARLRVTHSLAVIYPNTTA